MNQKIVLKAVPAALLAAFSVSAGAAGFALQNQNGAGTGNAFAGAAAVAEDASTLFFNPAGMAYLPQGTNLSLAATALQRKIEFQDKGTAPLIIPTSPTTATAYSKGTDGGDAGGVSLVPAGYLTYSLTPDFSLGLGVSPTFGNKTEYTGDFIGRFSGYYAELKIVNLNPSASYKVNDMLSFGAGINHASADIEFRQKAPVVAALPAAVEADVRLKGDDKAWGYNFGAMIQASKDTRIGLSYRSKIKFDLEGNMNQTVGATTSSTAIKAGLETPDTLSLALSQQVGDALELLADYTRTNWSSVQSIVVSSAASGAKITSLDYNFKDTYRVGLGANYRVSEALKLRAGVALDKSPVKTAADRTMTLPDSDRTWLSLGARYNLSKDSSVDFGYTHIFFDDADTERVAVKSGSNVLQTVKGSFDTSVDIVSLQYNRHF